MYSVAGPRHIVQMQVARFRAAVRRCNVRVALASAASDRDGGGRRRRLGGRPDDGVASVAVLVALLLLVGRVGPVCPGAGPGLGSGAGAGGPAARGLLVRVREQPAGARPPVHRTAARLLPREALHQRLLGTTTLLSSSLLSFDDSSHFWALLSSYHNLF